MQAPRALALPRLGGPSVWDAASASSACGAGLAAAGGPSACLASAVCVTSGRGAAPSARGCQPTAAWRRNVCLRCGPQRRFSNAHSCPSTPWRSAMTSARASAGGMMPWTPSTRRRGAQRRASTLVVGPMEVQRGWRRWSVAGKRCCGGPVRSVAKRRKYCRTSAYCQPVSTSLRPGGSSVVV